MANAAEARFDFDDDDVPDGLRARLNNVGMVGLNAETARCAPVPIGIIRGDTHPGVSRPPLNPQAVIEALKHLDRHRDVSDDELVAMIGIPAFPTGCQIEGNLDDLFAGRPYRITLKARITALGGEKATVRIDRFAPGVRSRDLMLALTWAIHERDGRGAGLSAKVPAW